MNTRTPPAMTMDAASIFSRRPTRVGGGTSGGVCSQLVLSTARLFLPYAAPQMAPGRPALGRTAQYTPDKQSRLSAVPASPALASPVVLAQPRAIPAVLDQKRDAARRRSPVLEARRRSRRPRPFSTTSRKVLESR